MVPGGSFRSRATRDVPQRHAEPVLARYLQSVLLPILIIRHL
jgi:hypothetical protein